MIDSTLPKFPVAVPTDDADASPERPRKRQKPTEDPKGSMKQLSTEQEHRDPGDEHRYHWNRFNKGIFDFSAELSDSDNLVLEKALRAHHFFCPEEYELTKDALLKAYRELREKKEKRKASKNPNKPVGGLRDMMAWKNFFWVEVCGGEPMMEASDSDSDESEPADSNGQDGDPSADVLFADVEYENALAIEAIVRAKDGLKPKA